MLSHVPRLVLWIVLLGAALAARAGASIASGVQQVEFGALPDVPTALGLGGPLVGVSGDALIVAGGANFPVPLTSGGAKVWHGQIFALLPNHDEWTDAGTLPSPRAYAACASTGKGVVVVGGSDDSTVFSDVLLMRWDAEAGLARLRALPSFPVPVAFGCAEAIGDRVFVFCGKRSKDDTDVSNAGWSLDLAAEAPTWQRIASLPGAARFKVVSAVQRGPSGEACVYAFSGASVTRNANGDLRFEAFTDAYRYTPSADDWTRLADLPVLEDSRGLDPDGRFAGERLPISAGSAHGFEPDSILTFSGSADRYILDESGQLIPPAKRPHFAPHVLRYDVDADRWATAGQMSVGVVTTRAVLWDGRIVIPSGEVKPGVRTPAVQFVVAGGSAAGTAAERPRLGTIDLVVIGLYLLAMVMIGAYFARKETSTDEFFLAGRKIPWWAAGLSIFGTQLSAITFMAIPATAYGSDWRRFAGQLMVLPVFVLVICCFAPLLRRLDVVTAYEYLEARFSRAVRLSASAIFILFQLGRMGIVLLLPAIALSAVTGVSTHWCIASMGVLATLYTALGGISAVIWTDVFQVIVLIGGAILCLVLAVGQSGGTQAAIEAAQAAGKFNIFDWRWSTTDMVAWVLIVGFLFTNLVPYTTDQTVIQRYLTTRNEREATKSLWLNFAIAIPTGVLFFGLGTALWAYYSSHPIARAALPAQADQLVPWFVATELPRGIAGLVIAGIFAAAMSSLDSSMNSISTAIVNDFVGSSRNGRGESRNHMRLARNLTVLLGAIGTAAAMVLATFEIKYLFDTFQKVIGLFGGGLSGVFLLAVFTKSANAQGALAGLVAGGGAALTVAYSTDVNFLLYAPIGTIVCVVVGQAVSLTSGGGSDE